LSLFLSILGWVQDEQRFFNEMMNIKWITLIYSLLLLLLVAVVDQGGSGYQWIFKMLSIVPYSDKIGHFLLMGILAFVVNLNFKCHHFQLFGISFLKGSAIVFFLVTLEEFSQIFVHSRTFDLGDLTADYVGILLWGQLAKYYYLTQVTTGDPSVPTQFVE